MHCHHLHDHDPSEEREREGEGGWKVEVYIILYVHMNVPSKCVHVYLIFQLFDLCRPYCHHQIGISLLDME